jgi:hypothetical protein
MAVTMKKAVFWDVTSRGYCKNRSFEGTNRLSSVSSQRVSVAINANVIPISPIVTMMMEALRSSETSILQEPHGVTPQTTAFFTTY